MAATSARWEGPPVLGSGGVSGTFTGLAAELTGLYGVRGQGRVASGKWYFEITHSSAPAVPTSVFGGIVEVVDEDLLALAPVHPEWWHTGTGGALVHSVSWFFGSYASRLYMKAPYDAPAGTQPVGSLVFGDAVYDGDTVGYYFDADTGGFGVVSREGDHGILVYLPLGRTYAAAAYAPDGTGTAIVNFGATPFVHNKPVGYEAGFGEPAPTSLSVGYYQATGLYSGITIESSSSPLVNPHNWPQTNTGVLDGNFSGAFSAAAPLETVTTVLSGQMHGSLAMSAALTRTVVTLDSLTMQASPFLSAYIDSQKLYGTHDVYTADSVVKYFEGAVLDMLQSELTVLSDIRGTVRSILEAYAHVGQQYQTLYSPFVCANTYLASLYVAGTAPAVAARFETASAIYQTIRGAFAGSNTFLVSEFSVVSSSKVLSEFSAANRLFDSIRSQFSAGSAISSASVLRSTLSVGSAITMAGTVEQAQEPMLYVMGAAVPCTSVQLTYDEGTSVWVCRAEVARLHDSLRLNINDDFQIDYLGETYAFVVDSKAVNRPASTVSIGGRSPTIRYAAPLSKPLTQTWDAPTAADQIANELIPGIQWNVQNWVVPAGVFAVENSTPFDAVSVLAKAAGAVIDTDTDGSIHVNYLHVTSVPDYGPLTASFTLGDIEINFTQESRHEIVAVANAYTIGVESNQAGDVVEFERDDFDYAQGLLYVYPGTWRDNVAIEATGHVEHLLPLGVVERTETNQVEFVAGEARTSYPVVSIQSVDWNTRNLGSVIHDAYNSALRCTAGATGYSLATITYTTKAHVFDLRGVIGFDVQLLVKD